MPTLSETINPAYQLGDIRLKRECSLPMSVLQSMAALKLEALHEKEERLLLQRGKCAEKLSEQFHALIPSCKRELSGKLIESRRKIYQGKPLSAVKSEAIMPHLPAETAHLLKEWLALQEQLVLIRQQINVKDDEVLKEERLALCDVVSREEFRQSVLLTGIRQLQHCDDYVRKIKSNRRLDKRARQTEAFILNYVTRMFTKPTPFARCTTQTLQIKNLTSDVQESSQPKVTMHLMILQWVVYQISRHSEIAWQCEVRVNETLKKESQILSYFTRAADGSLNMFGGERFVSLNATDELVAIIEECREQKHTHATLSQWCKRQKNCREQIVSKLIEIDLLVASLNVAVTPDQGCLAVADVLSQMNGELAKSLARQLYYLHELLCSLNELSTTKRSEIFERMYQMLETIAELLAVEPPAREQVKALVYEDNCKLADEQEPVFTRSVNQNITSLSRWVKLAQLFDDFVIERDGLYTFYVENFSSNEQGIPFLNLYQKFCQLDFKAMSGLMSGERSSKAGALKRLRIRFLDELSSRCSAGVTSVDLGEAWLDPIMKELEALVSAPSSVGVYLQPTGTQPDELVANGVTMGYGAMVSRFIQCLSKNDKNHVKNAFQEAYCRDESKIVADFDAVLGMNSNWCPRLFPHAISYPGTVPSEKESAISLSDLIVYPDHETGLCRLRHRTSLKEITFIPTNFLFPKIGPTLYRFIYLFSDYCHVKNDLWRRLYYYRRPGDSPYYCPRITVGNVTVSRETWIESVNEVSETVNQGRDKTSTGLMKEFYYHLDALEPVQEDWTKAMAKSLALTHNKKQRKPQYCDRNSPLMLSNFSKSLSTKDTFKCVIQECLPVVDKSSDERIAEYLVQIDYAG